MHDLKNTLFGKNPMVLCGLIVFFLVFGRVASVTGQENHFVIEPSALYVGAAAGTAEIFLGFSNEAVPWTAVAVGGWLTIEPQVGESSRSLRIIILANDGPARIGQIIFQSPSPSFRPAFFDVFQNQGLDPSMLDFQWRHLTIPYIDPLSIPNTGSATFHYLPWEKPVFLNIFGRSLQSESPVWLVRNVYLPDSHWMTETQNLWLPVDLGLLGYERGQPVELIEYSWNVSFEPDTVLPRYPDLTWTTAPVIPDTLRALGRSGLAPYPSMPVTDYYTDIYRPVDIQDLIYIGCDMPNGDLDDGARPGEVDGCGPAAAANSLSWLDKHHDDIDIPDKWVDAFNELSSLMRKRGKGTEDPDFIRAKLDFIEMYDLPIKVKYQDDQLEGDIKSSSGNSSAKCHDAKPGDMPTKEWMISEAEDDEDVEVGMSYPTGGGHWVVLTGTITINGKTYLIYKDDKKQGVAGGNDQGYTPIDETAGGMVLPGISNAKVDIVVSESYDPDHIPVSSEIPFERYCQSSKRTLPPGASITLTYPDNDKRCYNTSVRVLNHGDKKGYELKAVWNHNSGKQRTYVNDTGEPVTVEFHNDDHYDGGVPVFKSDFPYTVQVNKSYNQPGLSTDPSNEESYAGFSIGSDDESAGEFGLLPDTEVDYSLEIGSYFSDFPGRMNPAACQKISIKHKIKNLNRYWNHLGLIVGVYKVGTPGDLTYSSNATGISGTISISAAGDYRIDLGGVSAADIFDLTLEIDSNLDFVFDNLGVPSLVQVEPILEITPDLLVLSPDTAGQATFSIGNSGGSDLVWSLTKIPEWISAGPHSGINDDEVTIDFQENPGAMRQDTIIVEAGDARNSPAGIIVTQDAGSSGIQWNPILETELYIIPNPAKEMVTLRLSNFPAGVLNCRILDIVGREVWNLNVVATQSDLILPVDLASIPDGIYFVTVESAVGRMVRKMIRQSE